MRDISVLANARSLKFLNMKGSGVLDFRPLRNIVVPDSTEIAAGAAVGFSQCENDLLADFDPLLYEMLEPSLDGLRNVVSYLKSLDDIEYERRLAMFRRLGKTEEQAVSDRFPLAEEITQNPETGAFRAIPRAIAKPDLLRATLGQIADAVDDVLSKPSNGLNDQSLEVRKLRRTLERYANDPQRIEMDLTTVHSSLTAQIASGELPPSNENAALLTALQEGAQGIRATETQVAENRKILQEQALRELPQEALLQISDAAPVLEAIAEGDLREQLREDVLFLTREMRADQPKLPGVTKVDGVIPGRDEAVRVFGRSARILIAIRDPTELVHKLHESTGYKLADIISTLASLVLLGLSLFF